MEERITLDAMDIMEYTSLGGHIYFTMNLITPVLVVGEVDVEGVQWGSILCGYIRIRV